MLPRALHSSSSLFAEDYIRHFSDEYVKADESDLGLNEPGV
jgi:hypothetical protein